LHGESSSLISLDLAGTHQDWLGLLTAADIQAAPILSGREGEDVSAPFLEPRPWWSRLAFWR
jgi:hypothetical protein